MARTQSLAPLDQQELLKEFSDRLSGNDGKLTMQDLVLCAFEDFELTEQQFTFLCTHFDQFRL